ncbi:MAG: hypothetical protein NTX54_00150 [Chloroflexi bacterium]|nr:hypothetical protein [Chloroflexota bacterium]
MTIHGATLAGPLWSSPWRQSSRLGFVTGGSWGNFWLAGAFLRVLTDHAPNSAGE